MVEMGSFLKEELEAFDKIYTELLTSPYKTTISSLHDSNIEGSSHELESKENIDPLYCDSIEPDSDMELHFAAKFDRIRIKDDDGSFIRLPPNRSSRSPSKEKLLQMRKTGSHEEQSTQFWSGTPPIFGLARRAKSCTEAPFPGSHKFDTCDKLFLDLLDDLDSISGNTPSARRRKKARDMFAEWLFEKDKSMKAKDRRSFHEYTQDMGVTLSWLSDQEKSNSKKSKDGDKNVSHKVVKSDEEQDDEFHDAREEPDPSDLQNWRSRSSTDCISEDDTDSGYHTGDSMLQGQGQQQQQQQKDTQVAPPPPGEKTLTREELRKEIDAFNNNQHGLLMKLEESENTFQGFIRVYMNLMRPISMSLPARPPSIYDVLGNEDDDIPPEETLTTSFYLPKDTTKVIHISSDTTAQEVIKALLQKFKITDNPRKFALYERIEAEGEKPTMRRLTDEEKPLPLCLGWTAEGLNVHKFVLQENDTGEIMWEAFSVPELENFLKILDREEEEYVDQVRQRYHMLKIQMDHQLQALEKERQQYGLGNKSGQTESRHAEGSDSVTESLGKDTREPVFV